jgi:hypothetical protein
MIVDDNSTDLDALREDLKFELIVLHTEVKELHKGWDFTAIVNPLLADHGPALLVILRIKNQIERLKKLKDGFEQKARDFAAVLRSSSRSSTVISRCRISRHEEWQARHAMQDPAQAPTSS